MFTTNAKVYVLSIVKSTPATSTETTESENKEEKKEEAPGKQKYTECGKGTLHVNTYKSEDGKLKSRLVLRVDQTKRVALNAPIFPKMDLSLQGECYVRFCSSDLEGKPAVYLLRVKAKADAAKLLSEIQGVMALVEL